MEAKLDFATVREASQLHSARKNLHVYRQDLFGFVISYLQLIEF